MRDKGPPKAPSCSRHRFEQGGNPCGTHTGSWRSSSPSRSSSRPWRWCSPLPDSASGSTREACSTRRPSSPRTSSFTGVGGFIVHGINGMMIIPLLGLALLVVSFFAKVPGGVKIAAIVLGAIVVQVLLGIFGHESAYIGVLHGLNAFILFGSAVYAARLARTAGVETPTTASRCVTEYVKAHLRQIVAIAATLVIVVPLAWMWQASRMPGSYSVMDMGYVDAGGGPVSADRSPRRPRRRHQRLRPRRGHRPPRRRGRGADGQPGHGHAGVGPRGRGLHLQRQLPRSARSRRPRVTCSRSGCTTRTSRTASACTGTGSTSRTPRTASPASPRTPSASARTTSTASSSTTPAATGTTPTRCRTSR